MIATIHPATGETIATFDALTDAQLEDKLARSAEAYRTYRRTAFADRAVWMSAAARFWRMSAINAKSVVVR